MIAPRALDRARGRGGALVLLELLDELPVPLSEIVMASWASARVKSACTVLAIVPVAAVEVR